MVATITAYGYDKANRLIKEESHVAGEDGTKDTSIVKYSYAYDTNGNLLCRGTTTEYETYTYTKANMLESVTSTTKTAETKETYEYDAEGNRLSKMESKAVKEVDETTGEVTTAWEETNKTYYVMDTSGSYSQVIEELDKDKKVKVLYTRGDGIISREEVGEDGTASINFYLSDGHGDVRQLTDKAGKVTDSYRYNSYGELKETQGETDNPYLYTGEYYDEGTGLYYLRARYLSPETGTFTSMDTYRGNAYDPASLHRYTYAQNNPQMYNDPSGHFAIGLIGTATNLTCAQMIRSTCVTNMAGTLTGFVNGIINEMLGGEDDAGAAFVKGYLVGAGAMVGVAAAYAGAAAIRTLFVISDAIDMLSLAREVVECVKSIVLAIVFVVTGCHTQAAIYLSFAAIYFTDILVTLGLSGMIIAKGPKGRVGIGVKSSSQPVNNSNVAWNNGWRTPDGKFASPNDGQRAGEWAEKDVWEAIKKKDGWDVIEGRVYVKDATGQVRVFDGVAQSPHGRYIGLEIKSGNARKTATQKAFDNRIGVNNPAIGIGASKGIEITHVLTVRR